MRHLTPATARDSISFNLFLAMSTRNRHHRTEMRVGRKRVILIAAVVLAVGLIWAMFPSQSREPSYQGHSLSYWAEQVDPHDPSGCIIAINGILVPRPQEEAAIKQIGTNAIPTILDWISYEASPFKTKLASLVERLPHRVSRHVTFPGEERAYRAELVFNILGPEGRAAIPELTRLARTSSDWDRVCRCLRCLHHIGTEAFPSILSLTTNGPYLTCFAAIGTLAHYPEQAKPSIPVLLNYLDDTNHSLAGQAARVLGDLEVSWSATFPGLTNVLRSSSPEARLRAVRCVIWISTPSDIALPVLLPMLSDPDYDVRDMTTNVLQNYVPEMFTNAPGH
jgi:hypothetical protein